MLKIWTLLSFPMTMMFSQTGCSDPLVKYPIPHIGNITLLIFFFNPTITFVFCCNTGEARGGYGGGGGYSGGYGHGSISMDPVSILGLLSLGNYIYCIHLPF